MHIQNRTDCVKPKKTPDLFENQWKKNKKLKLGSDVTKLSPLDVHKDLRSYPQIITGLLRLITVSKKTENTPINKEYSCSNVSPKAIENTEGN